MTEYIKELIDIIDYLDNEIKDLKKSKENLVNIKDKKGNVLDVTSPIYDRLERLKNFLIQMTQKLNEPGSTKK